MKDIWCKLFGHDWRTFENPNAEGYRVKNWADGKQCVCCGKKEFYDY